MRQVASLISTYSSDEFGICSALYELGGMVVMHDASGCNSTYTTHDEPRWYDMDSMIYISAISEMEAIMGDDEKLIEDLVETAEQLQPAFIAIVGAPIPYMIGTDLPAIAAVTEERTGISCFGFAANGMHDYLSGMSMALEAVVKRFCTAKLERTKETSVNIIGATPLDFSLNGSVDAIKDWIVENGMELNACMAMGSSLEEISQAGRAHVNLVVSYGGLAAAKYLQERYDTPYVVGVPVGKEFAGHMAEALKESARTGESVVAYEQDLFSTDRKQKEEKSDKYLAIIGESVQSASLATAIELETGRAVRLLCPLETDKSLLRDGDLQTPEEDDLFREIPKSAGVIADPMYRPLVPEKIDFYDWPHEAFSGRIYDEVNPNLINHPLMQNLRSGIE